MRRFAIEILGFVALQLAVAAWVWSACPRPTDHYAAATADKRRRLEQCPSPRIIFVGGSSAAFGFDSRVAQDHGLEPVNMGHNRSLGLAFMLGQVESSLRPGDIVVVSPEYDLLWTSGVDSTLVTHLEYDPPSFAAVDVETGRRLLDRGVPWFARKVRCAFHRVSTAAPIGYDRHAFDETGDFASHRGRPAQVHEFAPSRWPALDLLKLEPRLTLLANFAETCTEAQARCVFAFSPVRRAQYDENRDTLEHLAKEVATHGGLDIVIPLGAAVFEHHAYFDTGPHLLPAFATERTQALMRAL